MKFAEKNIASLIALLLMLTIAVPLVTLPIANAHTPPWTIPSYGFITASPDPVGVGQAVLIVFWLNNYPPTASGFGGDRWRGLTVTVMKPNGDNQTLGTWDSDPVGGGYTRYTPDQVGTYKFVFAYPGQVLSRYGPTGIVGQTSPYENDTFLAATATTTLTVQEEPIPDPPSYPLPTEYWTRPVEGQNTGWYQVASNWLRSPQIPWLFQPDGIAPESAHIMWTKPLSFGGVVGGKNAINDGMTFYSGTHYEQKFMDPMIMYGRLYYSLPRSDASSGGGYVCVDLHTGETLWWQNYTNPRPSFGQLYDYESMNQHGTIPNGYLWATSGTTWYAYDPLDGNWLFTLTDVPSGTTSYGPQGEILSYVLNVPGKWLGLWNNTCENQGLHAATGTASGAYQWRPVGKTVNMSKAYSWNVTIPALPSGSTIRAIIPDDVILGSPTSFGESLGTNASGTPDPYTIWAISLKPESRGQLLWIKDYPAPAGNLTRTFPAYRNALDPVNRVFIMFDKETTSYTGYSIDDGTKVWGPTPSENPWNMYQHGGTGGAHNAIAYGKLYSSGYSGTVYCYDTKTGSLLWNYSAPSGFATAYPGYPLWIFGITDGKIYLSTDEHSANAPYAKGSEMRCLNATTGQEIWAIDSTDAGAMAFADGYLAYLNLYDMQIYCIGKGPSATTVSASPKVSVHGGSVLIEGTVIDTAAGTKQKEQAARFPNGVAAVSDDSMSGWMEYVYMQKPYPTDVTGVEVVVTVLDPNNNYYEVGRTTSDGSGFYSVDFTPEVPGKYTIVATFAGSKAYWPSSAETAIKVDEAVTVATPEPTQAPTSLADQYLLPATGGIIAAIAVVGALVLLQLRKR